MSDILQVLTGAAAASVVTGVPVWYAMRAQRDRTEAATGREEAETDSVIQQTVDRLLDVMHREFDRYERRIDAVEADNDKLRSAHERCNAELRDVREQLGTAHRERVALAGQVDRLTARVTALQGELDGHVSP